MIDPPAPEVIVATIPRWLDRRPRAGETVLVGFSDDDPDLAVCLALPPEVDPTEEVNAHRQLVVDGAEAVAVVAYTGTENGSPSRLEATLRFHAASVGRYGMEVLGVLVVVPDQRDRPGYWRNLPDPARFPLPTPARTEETP